MKFRTDIQILRAIAVIFVVLYHLEIPGFGNGLLGVDIFFAISGYLMYRIYDYDKGAGGFYARRARRLLPGYFATILCTLAAGFFIVLPSDFAQIAGQALFGSVFASNIGFWSQNTYFNNVDFKPLLHLWSLAVELQFYLFVPLIMRLDRWNKAILPALVAGSLALCLVFLILSPNGSFFMMPARLWQFGLGMIAARASARRDGNPVIGVAAALALIALLFFPPIGYGVGFIQGHPGLGAIIATAATALCLHHGLPGRMLDNLIGRAMRYIGDISYSIYLVHFPVIVLFNYQAFAGTILGARSFAGYAYIAALIALLGWLCHQIFEKRAAPYVSGRSAILASGLVIAAALLLPMGQTRMFDRYTNIVAQSFTDRAPYRCGTYFRIQHFRDEFCSLGSAGNKGGTIMLIGDSHSDAIKTAFVEEAGHAGLSVLFPVSNDALTAPQRDEKWLLNAARKFGVRHVFLHFSVENIDAERIDRARALLWKDGIAVTYIMPVPTRTQIIPQILLDAHKRGVTPPLLSAAEYERNIAPVAAKLRAGHLGYVAIEPKAVFCTPDCQIQGRDGRPYYFDTHHLTLTGAKLLKPLLRRAIALPQSAPLERTTRP